MTKRKYRSITCHRDVFTIGNKASGRAKVKNKLCIQLPVCPGDDFFLDLETIVSICCTSLGGGGFIALDSLEASISGPASITSIQAIPQKDCPDGCPDGSISGFLSPDGKQAFVIWDDFLVECDLHEGGGLCRKCVCKDKKCCTLRFPLEEDGEVPKKQPILFTGTISGFASLLEGCGGPFTGQFETDISIEAKFVQCKHPFCRSKKKGDKRGLLVKENLVKSETELEQMKEEHSVRMKDKYGAVIMSSPDFKKTMQSPT
ncbi:DUF4360 domain-containing protein [Rossellomorea sp. AcN35-11]|nr:DUF4360 domain-containing protein [Rossellomorea aquimaris]WJV29899.1 DUF4360 domain-containing protein [Rossellomorea sp. AcN35-11]